MATAFISYSTKNKSRATKLATELKENGINIWFAEWNILVGHSLEHQIYEGIKSSDYLLIILTKASTKSAWVERELSFARVLEIEQKKTFIIPLLFEKCEIPDSLKTKVYADFSNSFEIGLNKVLQVISDHSFNINLKEKPLLEIEEVLFLLDLSTTLRESIFYANETIDSKNKSRYNIEKSFCSTMNQLINYAKKHKINYICWEWIEWYKNAVLSGELIKTYSDSQLERKRLSLKKWVCGRPLFKGGVSNNLTLINRIILEIGNRLDGKFENAKELKKECLYLGSLYKFSEQFSEKVNHKITKPELFSLILYEFKNYNDYNWLISIYNGLMNEKAISTAFTLTYYLPFRVDTDKFITNAEVVTEFLISELGAFEDAFKIMEKSYELTFSKESLNIPTKNKNKYGWKEEDWIIYNTYMNSWASLKEKAKIEKNNKESVKWFLLTLSLGQLFFSKGMQQLMEKPEGMGIINVQIIDEIEQITHQTIRDKNLIKKINDFTHNVFYSKSINDMSVEKQLLDLIMDISNYCVDSAFDYVDESM